jgi:hypothetical protein
MGFVPLIEGDRSYGVETPGAMKKIWWKKLYKFKVEQFNP